MFVKNFLILTGLFAGCALSFTNPIYIITNAEQPSLSRPGLTPVGLQRAQKCIPEVFSKLNIGKIIMCPRNDDSEVCFETLDTTQPVATALGLPIDTSCGADENTDDNCVRDVIQKFTNSSTQSVLIVWDIQEIGALLGEDLDLDTDDADADDGIHFDLITVVVNDEITGIVSQNCTNIDGVAAGTGIVPSSPPTCDAGGSDKKAKNQNKRSALSSRKNRR